MRVVVVSLLLVIVVVEVTDINDLVCSNDKRVGRRNERSVCYSGVEICDRLHLCILQQTLDSPVDIVRQWSVLFGYAQKQTVTVSLSVMGAIVLASTPHRISQNPF